MKYYIAEIEETFGEYETTSRFVFSTPNTQTPESVMDAIARSFRGEALDDDEEPDGADGDYMFGCVRVRAKGATQIPQSHFEVLKLYLSDLTIMEES